MKKTLFWAASVACLCASCANDTMVEENRSSDEIRFKAYAEGSTRADAVYCPSVKPQSFNVFAYDEENNLVIDGDLIKLEGSEYKNQSGNRYWPESGKLTFEALLNGEKDNDGKVDFSVAAEAADQKDLIYARAEGQKSDGTVALNFRHALSQVVFKATNSNESLSVNISAIKVCNASGSGKYNLPTDLTNPNIDETGHNGNTYETTGRGSWSNFGAPASYTLNTDITLDKTTTAADISTANGENALMLIPNKNLVAWDAASAISEATTGTYFLLTVNIKQQVKDSETPVTIWDGDLAVPVSFGSWVEGKRYVYTFAFGKGNGGYDPENPDKPVFVPITFTVDVDEFVPVNPEAFEVGGK